MENQKRSEKYSNGWKRSPYSEKPGNYQKRGAPSPHQNPVGAKGQTTTVITPSAAVSGTSPSGKITDFRDLHVWKLGKELVLDVYKATKALPSDELYGLTTQLRRTALSIPSNISEGHHRRYTKDYQRFLSFALGSCAELETQIEVCRDLGYFSHNACGLLLEKMDHETRMIRSLMNKL